MKELERQQKEVMEAEGGGAAGGSWLGLSLRCVRTVRESTCSLQCHPRVTPAWNVCAPVVFVRG